MRILFSTLPQHGHLLPLLPLARAFLKQNDDVAFSTGDGYAALLGEEGMELLPAGPPLEAQLGELVRRTGIDPTKPVTDEIDAEFFGGVRVDLLLDEALPGVRAWQPDLIVSELYDFVGPFFAAALGVPWARLAMAPDRGAALADAVAKVTERRYRDRDLTPAEPRQHLDQFPPALQDPAWTPPDNRVALRAEPHREPGWQPTTTTAAKKRPAVLVTFGTQFTPPSVIGPILRELAEQHIDIKVTASSADYDIEADNVTFTGFTPLAELLHDVDAVVGTGSAGTALGALARGVPLVVVPLGADHFVVADRLAAAGAAVVLRDGATQPAAVAKAVADVLADDQFRARAQKVADEIAGSETPEAVAASIKKTLT